MERFDRMKPVNRISTEQLATAIKKVRSMSLSQKVSLIDEIFQQQPNLLASCLVQQRLGASEHKLEFLLNILLVCFQAMKESGHDWPLITEDEQERQLARYTGAVRFSEDLADPTAADAARAQYVASHAEAPLLSFVVNEINAWLRDLAAQRAEAESDTLIMMAAVNFVNCIASAHVKNAVD